jgi:hypothetical protein
MTESQMPENVMLLAFARTGRSSPGAMPAISRD